MDSADKGVTEIMTPGGRQKMVIINESGLYALIFGSKLESAKRFIGSTIVTKVKHE